MKIENINYIFLSFEKILNYSKKDTLNILKKWIEKYLKAKKITKKVLIKLFNTLNEYCKNIYNINIAKTIFEYDIKSIILRFNY